MDKLRSVSPLWGLSSNPWDLGLTVQFRDPAVVYRALIEAVIEDPNVDGLALQLHPSLVPILKGLIEVFHRAVDARKPIVLWIAGVESGRLEILRMLEEKQILVVPSPEKAIRALSALHRLSSPASKAALSL